MASGDEWVLYYWPGFPGRAEFVRIVFEEVGQPFKEINEGIAELSMAKGGRHKEGYPIFGVPMIKRGTFNLSQTPVICKYLAKQFGLWPDQQDEWHADQVNQTIHDFIAEGCLVFHGKNFVDAYANQVEETKPYIKWFLADRLPRWLQHFEQALAQNNGGHSFLFGDKLTYVDLALLHVLRAAASQFPEDWQENQDIPLLKAFKDRISARPNLAAYFKSDRCQPFEGNSMM